MTPIQGNHTAAMPLGAGGDGSVGKAQREIAVPLHQLPHTDQIAVVPIWGVGSITQIGEKCLLNSRREVPSIMNPLHRNIRAADRSFGA
jgi:hypothetical protein